MVSCLDINEADVDGACTAMQACFRYTIALCRLLSKQFCKPDGAGYLFSSLGIYPESAKLTIFDVIAQISYSSTWKVTR